MNQERRKKIGELIDKINGLAAPYGARQKVLAALEEFSSLVEIEWDKVIGALDELKGDVSSIKEEVEGIKDEEEETYDNMPESFQNGERGENSQTAINAMDEAMTALDEVAEFDPAGFETPDFSELDRLDDAVASLEEATSV